MEVDEAFTRQDLNHVPRRVFSGVMILECYNVRLPTKTIEKQCPMNSREDNTQGFFIILHFKKTTSMNIARHSY